MAKYLVLIYGDEAVWDAQSEDEARENMERHGAFGAHAGKAVLDGAELHRTSTATSIRGDAQGTQSVTDGPFLETKEALGGFYLLEAADLDEAIALARQVPEASKPHSGVEVRPVVGRD